MTVRQAEAHELPAVMGVLDAAMLDADAAVVADRIDDGTVLVAVDGDRVLGACVVDHSDDGAVVEAIAVRPGRRGQGVGSALVAAATARWGELSAVFDESVRAFYESLGFDVEPLGPGRFRGRLRDVP